MDIPCTQFGDKQMTSELSRRDVLRVTAVSSGAMLVGCAVSGRVAPDGSLHLSPREKQSAETERFDFDIVM